MEDNLWRKILLYKQELSFLINEQLAVLCQFIYMAVNHTLLNLYLLGIN